MGVVGRHQLQVEVLRIPGQRRHHAFLLGDAVALHLQEVAVAKDLLVAANNLSGASIVALGDAAGHFAGQAARERDHTLGVLRQHLHVDAGLVVHALQMPNGGELHQVDVALVVGRQQGQVVGVGVQLGVPSGTAPRRHVGFVADDWPDPRLLARLVEGDGAVHDSVVGQRQRLLSQLDRTCHHLVYSACPVQQAELGVVVQVHELGVLLGFLDHDRWRSPLDGVLADFLVPCAYVVTHLSSFYPCLTAWVQPTPTPSTSSRSTRCAPPS